MSALAPAYPGSDWPRSEASFGGNRELWENCEIRSLKQEVEELRRVNEDLQKQLDAKSFKIGHIGLHSATLAAPCVSSPRPAVPLEKAASKARLDRSAESWTEVEPSAAIPRDTAQMADRVRLEDEKRAEAERRLSELQGTTRTMRAQIDSLSWECRASASEISRQQEQVDTLQGRLSEMRASKAARLAQLVSSGERLDACTRNIEGMRADINSLTDETAVLTEKRWALQAQLSLWQHRAETSKAELVRQKEDFNSVSRERSAEAARLKARAEEGSDALEVCSAKLRVLDVACQGSRSETFDLKGSLARARHEYDALHTQGQEIQEQRERELVSLRSSKTSLEKSYASTMQALQALQRQVHQLEGREQEARKHALMQMLAQEQESARHMEQQSSKKLKTSGVHIQALEQQLSEEQLEGDRLTADLFAASAAAARAAKHTAVGGQAKPLPKGGQRGGGAGSGAAATPSRRGTPSSPRHPPRASSTGRQASRPSSAVAAAATAAGGAGACSGGACWANAPTPIKSLSQCKGCLSSAGVRSGSQPPPVRSNSRESRRGRCMCCGRARRAWNPQVNAGSGGAEVQVEDHWDDPVNTEINQEVQHLREWKRQAAASVERMVASHEAVRNAHSKQVQYGRELQQAVEKLSRRASEVAGRDS